MYKEHFTNEIKKTRIEKGYTQQKVADETGIAQNTICRIENGTREPDIENLGKLIDFYKVDANKILGTNKKESD